MTKDTIDIDIKEIFKKEILENNIQNLIITSKVAIIAIPFFTPV